MRIDYIMQLDKIIKELERNDAIQKLGFGEEEIPCQHLYLYNEIYGCRAKPGGEVMFPNECTYQLNKRGFFYNACFELTPVELLYLLTVD